ncbi:cysteine dioxygenase [Williamsia sterculiae]|uniref:Cysteine dioxygenase type I n=1 Tax=Williamsia sterculiae TaxID=1344003 RepID=A0A1N7FRI3_9NOCA|nr:cysteine dioxygenase family protein [Williamsia sterculiae]SIS02972.1 Cysteine dioxygenase type I [Williamsia sterculiae]
MTSTLSRPTTTAPTRPRLDTRSRGALPTRFRLPDLLRITDQGAADVIDGHYDRLLPDHWDRETRWSTRLHSDDDLDLWLISWTPDESTELHDHAGSLGALTVLSGSLVEYRWTGEDLRARTLDEGDQGAFGLGWVHDVMRNPASPITSEPTLSVHAYSPPLTAMSYYEVTDHQSLRRTSTVLTDVPE